jgi:hypothetical protein
MELRHLRYFAAVVECFDVSADISTRFVVPKSISRFPAQLSDATTVVIGDSGQTHSQVGCRITVSQFSRSDQVRLGGIMLTDALFVHCRLLPQGAV